MDVKRGEHTVLATFSNNKNVEEAVKALKGAGILEVHLDRINRFGINSGGQVQSQGTSILGSDEIGEVISSSAKVLLSSDPSISNSELENYNILEDEKFMISIVANTNQLNQALKIIEKYGGEI